MKLKKMAPNQVEDGSIFGIVRKTQAQTQTQILQCTIYPGSTYTIMVIIRWTQCICVVLVQGPNVKLD